MKVTANINALLQKHNFVKGVVEYSVELSVLGTRVVVPVNEDFVQKLDSLAESSAKQDRAQEVRNKLRSRPAPKEEFDYSLANVDEDEYQSQDDEYEQA
jgi:uncharacterized protein (DUF2126 family)